MHFLRSGLLMLLSTLCGTVLSQGQEPVAAAPAPAIVTAPADKENFHIYLLMGQSNMVGRDTSGLEGQVDNPRILSLNADGAWVLGKDPVHPKVDAKPVGASPGLPFAQEMIKTNPKITVGLVGCAVGGTALNRWTKATKGDLYANAVKRAKLAAQTGVIKGMLWHQGESDTSKQDYADTYEARLNQMFQDLRADLGTPDLPIVVGQLGDFLTLTPDKYPYAATVCAALKHIPTVLPHVGFADSAGAGHKGDKLHFSVEGARVLGERYARAMQELNK